MADKLLIRAYNVGVGDCVYCRVPRGRVIANNPEDFHILIDCGSWSGGDYLKTAMQHLVAELPPAEAGKKRLDLLVVTHEHKDHIAGFDPELFENVKIESLWMSAAMDLEHPQAGKTPQLHSFASRAMREIASLNLSLSPELQDLAALFSIDNDGAMEALREILPRRSGIKPKY